MADLYELREALLSTSGAAPLEPKIISRTLLQYIRRFCPSRRIFARETWGSNIYFFDQQNALPKTQMTTEAPALNDVAATSSNYVQLGYPIKHLQNQIDLADFAVQTATALTGNLKTLELAAAAKSYGFFEEVVNMWGSAGATVNTKRPQYDGVDLLMANVNKIDAGSTLFALKYLDYAIDAIKGIAAQELGMDWAFITSSKMQTAINAQFQQLQRFEVGKTRVFARDDYGIPNVAVADNYLDAGIEVATYRNIPIMTSSFLSSVGAMTAVVASAAGTGSSLVNSAYFYAVEAVTNNGITTAVEANVTPAVGQNITLTWTTPVILDVFGNAMQVLGYRVFRSAAASGAGSESLYALVSSLDANDSPVLSWTDTGLPVNPYAQGSVAISATVATVGANAAPDGYTFPRLQTAGQNVEDILLVPRNPEYCVVPVVNEMTPVALAKVNARTTQFAMIGDQTLALRAPAFAAKVSRVRTA